MSGARADRHTQHRQKHEPGNGGPANQQPSWWTPGRVGDPPPVVPSMECLGAMGARLATRQRRPAEAKRKIKTPPHRGSVAGSPAPPPSHPQPAHVRNGSTAPHPPRLARRSALRVPNTARLTNPTQPASDQPACPTRVAASSPTHLQGNGGKVPKRSDVTLHHPSTPRITHVYRLRTTSRAVR